MRRIADNSLERERSKHKKVYRRRYGVRPPPAAVTLRLCARQSQSRLAATAFPTSMRRKLVLPRLQAPPCQQRTRPDAHEQAPCRLGFQQSAH